MHLVPDPRLLSSRLGRHDDSRVYAGKTTEVRLVEDRSERRTESIEAPLVPAPLSSGDPPLEREQPVASPESPVDTGGGGHDYAPLPGPSVPVVVRVLVYGVVPRLVRRRDAGRATSDGD